MRQLIRRLARAVLGRNTRGTARGHEALVTEQDVVVAYRLLLGRAPDPDGWRNYTAMVGRAPVAELVASLLCSEEFRSTSLHRALARGERDRLEVVDVGDGLRLLVSPDDVLNTDLHRTGRYEQHLARALDAALRRGMTFCAVGANVGYHAIRAASRVGPEGRVYALEAHAGNALLLARNVALNRLRNVTVLPVAVADRFALYRYVAAQGTNGYLEEVRDDTSDVDTLRDALLVQAIPLDHLAGAVSRVDVLQIDVEGAEALALRGAAQLTSGPLRPVIFSELCLGQLARTSAVSGEEYLGLLEARGYAFTVLGFDGTERSFGTRVHEVCTYAREQPTSHVDVRCDPVRSTSV